MAHLLRAIMTFRGWRKNDYSNIKFSRRFHPPIKECIIKATWDDIEKLITIHLPSFKYFGEMTDSKAMKEMIRLLNHESIHGVILSIQWKDKVPESDIGNAEFPLEHGLDPDLSKEIKLKCDHCSKII